MKLKHIVLVKFKPNCSQQAIANCLAELASLQQILPGIESFSSGEYSSHEGLNRGFTHCFEMTFSDATQRDHYLIAPEHVKVADKLLDLCAKEEGELQLIAFDYFLTR